MEEKQLVDRKVDVEDYNKLFEIIKRRRSVRAFKKGTTIPWKTIKEILEASCWAPSAGNHQQWLFVVVIDTKLKQELAKLATHKLNLAPVAIFCFYSERDTRHPLDNIMSVSAAIQNMLLAATAKGVASLWVAGFTKNKLIRGIMRKKLNVSFEYKLLSIVLLGDAKFDPPIPGRKPFGESCFINKVVKNVHPNKSLNPYKWSEKELQQYMDKLLPIFTSREFEKPQRDLAYEVMKFIPSTGHILDLQTYFASIQRFYSRKNKDIIYSNNVEQTNIYLRKELKTEKVLTFSPFKIPFKKDFFDCIILTETLNYFPHKKPFREIKRVLKKKGELIVLVKKRWSFDHLIYLMFKIIHPNSIFKQLFEFKKGPCYFFSKRKIINQLKKDFNIKSIEKVSGKLILPLPDKVLKPFNWFKKMNKDYYLIHAIKNR